MSKDFDKWNTAKKEVDNLNANISFYPDQIWWCSAGLNIGHEIDGKHNTFERPFYIIKKCNKTMFIAIPCTSNYRKSNFSYVLKTPHLDFVLNFSQIKTLSSKRLLRKIVHVPSSYREDIVRKLFDYIKRKSAQ